MQRTGRKGHAMFRLVVQESRYTPTSGKVVAQLGSYDPHNKTARVDSEKASFYLSHGAQPSGRAALLLQKEGVDLPKWVKISSVKSRTTRHPEKLRSKQPAAEAEGTVEPDAPEAAAEVPEAETAPTES
jgi:small subunit ribosomal protein S16